MHSFRIFMFAYLPCQLYLTFEEKQHVEGRKKRFTSKRGRQIFFCGAVDGGDAQVKRFSLDFTYVSIFYPPSTGR